MPMAEAYITASEILASHRYFVGGRVDSYSSSPGGNKTFSGFIAASFPTRALQLLRGGPRGRLRGERQARWRAPGELQRRRTRAGLCPARRGRKGLRSGSAQ